MIHWDLIVLCYVFASLFRATSAVWRWEAYGDPVKPILIIILSAVQTAILAHMGGII